LGRALRMTSHSSQCHMSSIMTRYLTKINKTKETLTFVGHLIISSYYYLFIGARVHTHMVC
jgi:hypothetical protein